MEFEEKELQTSTITTTTTEPVSIQERDTRLDNLPRLEDLLKSEQEVKPKSELIGLKKVDNASFKEDKQFTMKEDEKKALVKKRVKVLSAVYIAVSALLFVFMAINCVTLAILDRDISSNANTIQSKQQVITILENQAPDDPVKGQDITVNLNEPRDYSDDSKDLTMMDKLSILFRNIFG